MLTWLPGFVHPWLRDIINFEMGHIIMQDTVGWGKFYVSVVACTPILGSISSH
jgi:hypothetical protein